MITANGLNNKFRILRLLLLAMGLAGAVLLTGLNTASGAVCSDGSPCKNSTFREFLELSCPPDNLCEFTFHEALGATGNTYYLPKIVGSSDYQLPNDFSDVPISELSLSAHCDYVIFLVDDWSYLVSGCDPSRQEANLPAEMVIPEFFYRGAELQSDWIGVPLSIPQDEKVYSSGSKLSLTD